MSPRFPIEFLVDVDVREALDRFFAAATPLMETFGYTVEARGADWAHWTTGRFGDVVRAYAFAWESEHGVSVIGQGVVPGDLPQALRDHIVETTGWAWRSGGPS